MPFSEVFYHALEILSTWSWLIFPLVTFHVAWYIWMMYWELVFAEGIYEKLVFLRIQLPAEILSTPKSMEQVFHSIHGIMGYIRPSYQVVWRQRQPWISCEVLGMNGSMYFIVAVEKQRRPTIENALYSEYPDIEIEEIEDYTLTVPLDIPNKDWNLYGYEFGLNDEDIWQFKTFMEWGIDQETEPLRNVDPLSQLAEFCTSLKPGEYLWWQLLMSPVPEGDWHKRARKVRAQFDYPAEPKPSTSSQVFQGISDFFSLVLGRETEADEKKQERVRFPTTIEVGIVKVLGAKLERPSFEVNMRFLYLGQRDVYESTRRAAIRGFVRPFADYTNNSFRSQEKTETRIRQFVYLLPEMRVDLKRRRMLWYYRMRYLRREEVEFGEFGFVQRNIIYRLNTLELATLYHFPGKEVSAPGLSRLPFRKAQPPSQLPTV